MTILQTAYETLTLKNVNTKNVEEAITQAYLGDRLRVVAEDVPVLPVIQSNGLSGDIEAFNHPIEIKIAGKRFIAMDFRYFIRAQPGSIAVKHPTDYQLAVLRAGLTSAWCQEGARSLLGMATPTIGAYADWITSALTSRLTPQEYVTVKILVAFYYYSQFNNPGENQGGNNYHAVTTISRSTRYPASHVQNVIGELPYIDSLTDFITLLKETTQSIRLKDLNPGLMVTMLLSGWFGINQKEIVAAAVEHPPTWMALCAMALSSSLHRKTKIALSVNRAISKGDAPVVSRALLSLASFDTINKEIIV